MEPQHGFTKWFSVPLGHSPYIDPPLIENNTVYPGKGFVTDLITDKSIEYIKELAAKAKKETIHSTFLYTIRRRIVHGEN